MIFRITGKIPSDVEKFSRVLFNSINRSNNNYRCIKQDFGDGEIAVTELVINEKGNKLPSLVVLKLKFDDKVKGFENFKKSKKFIPMENHIFKKELKKEYPFNYSKWLAILER